MTSKHSTFFELRDALGRPGCVVCRLAARSVRRYLEALAFESVNDLGLRAALRRSRGFCNLHAWQLLDEAREPFGAGIIYRDVLNGCAETLARGAGARSELAGGGECLACDARARSAARYVDALVDHVNESEIARRLEDGGGLCWRHFALGLARGGRGVRALARAQLAAIERVSDPAWRPTRPAAAAPTAGVRAGTAAPRPAADEEVGDPLVALVVGLRGVHGPLTTAVAARGRGGSPAEGWGGSPAEGGGGSPRRRRGVAPAAAEDAPLSEWDECAACRTARRAVHGAARALDADDAAGELCPPHAWLGLDLCGPAVVRRRLGPSVEHLCERIASAADDLRRAESIGIGRLAVATPSARRARGDLALRLSPGQGCAVCQAQLAAEEAGPVGHGDVLCRPHLLALDATSAATMGHWRSIVADLDEYIRKNDYRFRDEPRGPEQRSPWRAASAAAAGPGLR
ncbi:MAG TPA: hypothetical protein VG370_02000 [Chloroflexota bacterium]|nr:hypothetical protein [Chloroflexota bacterium]